jgi:predicted nucleic acid-binding protein
VRAAEPVFVDTGAWIALALTRDPLHARARDAWERLLGAGARFHTSVPVVLETFTFLDRNALRNVAVAWKDSLSTVRHLKILPGTAKDLEQASAVLRRADLPQVVGRRCPQPS